MNVSSKTLAKTLVASPERQQEAGFDWRVKQPLQTGMLLDADIMLERRRLYEWVLEPLISLTGKL